MRKLLLASVAVVALSGCSTFMQSPQTFSQDANNITTNAATTSGAILNLGKDIVTTVLGLVAPFTSIVSTLGG